MEGARKRILQMLSEGRISVDEADELLAAMHAGTSSQGKTGDSEGQRSKGWSDIEFDIDGLGERIHQTVMRGLERVERELRDIDVRMKREDWPRHWKMGGRARTGRAWSRTSTDEKSEATPSEQPQPEQSKESGNPDLL
jgi:hypothetical protein